MVLTLKSYAPVAKPSSEDSSAIDFRCRILTRYGAVLIDFGQLQDLISYSDNLAVDGGSGNWSIRMKATSDNINLLKNIHPGLCIEVYCSRGPDPLTGVMRDPSKIVRKDSTPKIPKVEPVQVVQSTGGGAIPASVPSLDAFFGINNEADLYRLAVVAMTEGKANSVQSQIDSAVSIGNRVQVGAWGKSASSVVSAAGQYEAYTRFGLQGVNDRASAIAALRANGRSEAALDDFLRAFRNPATVNSSIEHLKGSTDYRAYIPGVTLPAQAGDPQRASDDNYYIPGGTNQASVSAAEAAKLYTLGQQAVKGGVSTAPTAVSTPTIAPSTAKVSAGSDISRAGKVTMARTGKKDSNNLEILKLTVHDKSGNPISTHDVVSGIAQTQDQFGGFGSTKSGSKAPVEIGEYRIGAPIASGEPGVGKTFIPIDPNGTSDRTAIGFHVDQDKATNPGTKGCIAFGSEEDFAKFQAALAQSGATTFVFEKEPAKATPAAATGQTIAGDSPDVIGPAVEPQDDPYLDKCPYLLLRGIITDYGRATDNSSNLTITGAGYGKVYEDAVILTDATSPELKSQALETRIQSRIPLGVSYIYYRILREWVEQFWGEPNGWEARTRVIPFPPNYITRINSDGSAWQNLKAISIDGFFSMWVDHTGAIVWEKLPWSGKDQSLIAGRNWENVPLEPIPSKFIISWNDRISERGIANFIKCVGTHQGNPGVNPAGWAAYIYNQGSIRQYGGPTKKELQFPVGTDSDQYYTSEPMRKQKATILSFTSLCALECIRWYDRPVQRCGITMRGDAHLRIGTRLSVTENWHNLKAKPGEYYVVSRSHSISVESGSWTTSLELVRDRRQRYLGIGVGEVPIVKNTDAKTGAVETNSSSPLAQLTVPKSEWTQAPAFKQAQNTKPSKKPEILPSIDVPEYNVPLSADDYWFFDRITGQVVRIGNDPIKWARENVIPKLGEQGKPIEVVLPSADTGSVQTGPVGEGGGRLIAPFRSGLALGSVYDPAGTINTRRRAHNGVDLFPSTEGDDTLIAIGDGVVSVKSSSCPNYPSDCGDGLGNWLEVELSGSWSGWKVRYGHCAKILASNGPIKAGQAVAIMGDSGWSGGPHVHLEIWKGGGRVNPMRHLPPPSARFTSDAGADYLAGG